MQLQIELWQLLSILGTLVTGMIGGMKFVLAHIDNRFEKIEAAYKEDTKQISRIERELLELKAELPRDYQRREDAIRNQSIIESKIDGLALKIENNLLRGDHHG